MSKEQLDMFDDIMNGEDEELENDTPSTDDDTVDDADVDDNDAVEDENDSSEDVNEDGEDFGPPMDARPERGPNGEVLDKNGNVIAATKRERELLFNSNRMRVVIEDRNKKLATSQEQIKKLSRDLADAQFVYGDAPRKLNLNNDQVLEAMRFRAKIEIDPVTAVREILARVMENGYTIEQLLGSNEATGFINSQLIERQLEKKLEPITRRFNQEEADRQVKERASEQLNQFLDEHPGADTHGEEIAKLVELRGISPTAAYYAIREFTIRNNLDFTKPLAPQIKALNQNKPRPKLPPNTRSASPQRTSQMRAGDADVIGPSTSYRDIVAGVVKSTRQ